MDLDLKELELVINSGDFPKLLGESESEIFDCKRNVYDLKSNTSKFELAKDVSSFANAGGGFILIGLETEKSETSYYDEIIAIHPFKQNVCNHEQYIDVIFNWIYPKLGDIDAKWFPVKDNPEKGIFVIKIPLQKKDLKPFLITRTLKETGKFNEVLFGYSERRQEKNDPKTVIELQQILKEGLNYSDNIDSRLQSIEANIQTILKLLPPPKREEIKFEEVIKVDERIKFALKDVGLNQKRAMVLSAYPDSVVQLRTIFSSDQQSLKHKLEYPPTIRSSGFDLRTLDRASIISGKFCRVTKGDRKVIDLYEDGALIAGFKADEDYLCWAMKGLKINSVVLIESVYTFVLFYELVIEDMDTKPKLVNFKVDLHNFHLDNKKNYLVPYGLDTIAQAFDDEKKIARDNNWSKNIEVDIEKFEVASTSYKIVERIYLYFGIEVEKIPYTKEVEGERIVDIEQIKSI